MAKLRRLNGNEVINILEGFGFRVVRVKGSHHRLERTLKDTQQALSVPVHGNKPLATGMLKAIYRDACDFIPEKKLKPFFYTD